MNLNKRIAALLPIFLLVAGVQTHPTFAAVEVTAAIKSAIEKTAASADDTQKNKITKQFNDFLALQDQDRHWDKQIKAIGYTNDETLAVLRKQIQLINANKLDKLEQQVAQTKERYEPLFAIYRTLDRKQASAMQPAVQLARLDIRMKQNALKTAKDDTSKIVKTIRATLADIEPIEIKIKAERSAANQSKKQLSSKWKLFGPLVKKTDAKRTSDALTTLVSLSDQIVDHKMKIHTLERKIGDILLKAKGQAAAN